jgi:hypothetical protein
MTATSWGPKNEPEFADGDAPDVALNPKQAAAYAGKVGNRRVGTTAERNAAAGKDLWVGLAWGDTTDGNDYKYTSGGWVVTYENGTWVNLTLQDSATVVDGLTPQYRRKNGVTFVHGRLSQPNATSFTIPAGFRPNTEMRLAAVTGSSGSGVAVFVINSAGVGFTAAGAVINVNFSWIADA